MLKLTSASNITFLTTLLLLPLLSFLISCGVSNDARIGILLPQNEASPYYGAQEGIELAVKNLEATGLPLVSREATCKKDEDLALAEELITQEKVIAIIGGCNESSLAIATLAEEYKVVFVTPTSGNDELQNFSYTFRTSISDQEQITFSAKAILNEGLNQLAILYQDNTYNQDYAEQLAQQFKELGGEVLYQKAHRENKLETLKEIKRSKADALFFAFDNPNVLIPILEEMNEVNFDRFIFPNLFGTEKLKTLSLAKTAGSDGLTLIANSSATQKFFESYFAVHKALPKLYSAQGYASFDVVYQGLEEGAETGEALKTELQKLDFENSLGKVKFNNNSLEGELSLYMIINGEFLKR